MKTAKIPFFLFLMFFLFPLIVFAGDISDQDHFAAEVNASLGLQGWFSQANAKWQTSFAYITSAGAAGRIESRLDFKKIDSPLIIATASGNVAPRFAIELLSGYGSISGGRGTDTDRFIASSGGGVDFSQSTNRLDGDTRLWGMNIYYNARRFAGKLAGPWGLVLGYLHYGDNLRMTNAAQTVSVQFDGSNYPPVGPFSPGQVLNSTYDFSWDLLKVGVVHQVMLARQISYSVTLSVYPYVNYQGEGYWNLRAGTNSSDFRLQSPNFSQTSNKGYGYEAALGLGYAFSEHAILSAGYRVFYVRAENGVNTIYFADGSTVRTTLDWATDTRQGAYAELLFRF